MEDSGPQRPRFRTHATELSDDELLIMDALFDGGRLLGNLVRKWFEIQINMKGFRPGGQAHPMPGPPGPGLIE